MYGRRRQYAMDDGIFTLAFSRMVRGADNETEASSSKGAAKTQDLQIWVG